MAGNYIAATPTKQAAAEYVAQMEQGWGQSGEILQQTLQQPGDDGPEVWRIRTEENLWDVWMERAGDGFRVYGEC